MGLLHTNFQIDSLSSNKYKTQKNEEQEEKKQTQVTQTANIAIVLLSEQGKYSKQAGIKQLASCND